MDIALGTLLTTLSLLGRRNSAALILKEPSSYNDLRKQFPLSIFNEKSRCFIFSIMPMKGLLFIFMLTHIFFEKFVTCENILVVMPMCWSSHLRSFIPLVEELIRDGHNVTMISKFPLAHELHTKYNHVEVKTNRCSQTKTKGLIIMNE